MSEPTVMEPETAATTDPSSVRHAPCWQLETTGDTAVLTIDCPDKSANVLDQANLIELEQQLRDLAEDHTIKGLVVVSGKPGIFIAGADIKVLRDAGPDQVAALIDLGQSVFNRLSDLPFPTVAAIHGACAGGGFELALACTMRIASDHPKTKIGLPETKLGLIPGWGGSTRLPALIGLDRAAPLVMSGTLLPAKAAMKKGMVDRVVAPEHLMSQARLMLRETVRRKHGISRRLIHLPGIREAWKGLAARSLARRTGGHYPAPKLALEVMTNSVSMPRTHSLRAEREAFQNLATRPETRNLLNLFFLNEQARKWRPALGEAATVELVVVIGAGVMGAGIAYWLATRGHTVLLQDVNADALARGLKGIRKRLDEAVARRILDATAARAAMDRILASPDEVPLQRFTCLIEAAPENMELKKSIYRSLAPRMAADAIWCSNTSALPIDKLADAVPDPSRFVGLHFFNPVERMPLVEVIPGVRTHADTTATAVRFAQSIGKLPVVVKDCPGFLVNRILMPYLMAGVRLFEQGHPAPVIDRAMLSFGMPMGPLRLLDEVGIDVAMSVSEALDTGADVGLLKAMVSAGFLGRKSGRGFYLHKKPGLPRRMLNLLSTASPLPPVNRKAAGLIRSDVAGDRVPTDQIADHLAGHLTRAAKHALADCVVDDAGRLDFAIIAGTGYPPFRGGPLTHASSPIQSPT